MSEKPLFLSTSCRYNNILPIEFRLMNGYVHQLFLSVKPDDIVVQFSSEIPYTFSDGVLTIDLRGKDGNYSFSFTLSSISLNYEMTYRVLTDEMIKLETIYGKYISGKDILSLTDNQKGSLFFSRWLRKKTLYFDVLSFNPLTYQIEVKVREEDKDKRYFVSMIYDAVYDEIELSLYLEEYTLEDSNGREIIRRERFVRLREKE